MTTYSQHPFTPQLLAQTWANLWDRGAEEFRRLGLTLDQAFYLFLDYASHSSTSGILLADERPILAAGICPDEGGAFTFMQATKDFNQHKLAITRTMRRDIRAHVGPLWFYSTLVHPESEKFYLVLGMELDDWQGETATGTRLYRFKRRQ